jgi:heat shock protein HslJ
MKSRIVVSLLLLLIGSLAVSAQEADMSLLADTLWQLESYQNAAGEVVPVLPDTDITLEFGADQVGGSAGCNSYGGSYHFEGETLQFSELFSTMMYCAPDERMQQESAYLAALGTVAAYRITDHQLELRNADGTVVLTFQLVEPIPLAGTLWLMTSYNNGAGGVVNVLEGSTVTAQFDAEGRVSGSAGCNSYSASYTTSNRSLTISTAISTLMACPEPAGIMEQEQAYLAALENVTTYDIRGNMLALKDSEGAVMVQYVASIVGITWAWQSTEETGGAVSSVPNSDKYTLTFDAAGRVAVLADCNRGSGSYEIDGDEIRIGPLALTRALCPPDSLSDAFVAHLGAVSSLELVDGQLRLSPGRDGQTLIFAPAG